MGIIWMSPTIILWDLRVNRTIVSFWKHFHPGHKTSLFTLVHLNILSSAVLNTDRHFNFITLVAGGESPPLTSFSNYFFQQQKYIQENYIQNFKSKIKMTWWQKHKINYDDFFSKKLRQTFPFQPTSILIWASSKSLEPRLCVRCNRSEWHEVNLVPWLSSKPKFSAWLERL